MKNMVQSNFLNSQYLFFFFFLLRSKKIYYNYNSVVLIHKEIAQPDRLLIAGPAG